MWGHACSPLVDGRRLVVQVGGKPDACLVALDKDTGKELWRSLADRPGYSSPVLVEGGNWRLLAFFTPQHVVGLDPESGKVRWRVPFEGITYDVAISDVAYLDGVLLASNYWSGSKALRFDADGLNPEVAWEGKEAVTFSDAITAVRRWLWTHWVFPRAGHAEAFAKLPRPFQQLLLRALAPAA